MATASTNRWISLGDRALSLAKKTDSLALLVARLTVGVLFVSTGWGKVNNLAKITEFLPSLWIPMPGFNAVLRATPSWFAGFCSSSASPAGSPRAPRDHDGRRHPDRQEERAAQCSRPLRLRGMDLLAILLVIFALGPGKIALDALVEKRLHGAHRDQNCAISTTAAAGAALCMLPYGLREMK